MYKDKENNLKFSSFILLAFIFVLSQSWFAFGAVSMFANKVLSSSNIEGETCQAIWNGFLKNQSPQFWIALISTITLPNAVGEIPCKKVLEHDIKSKLTSHIQADHQVPVEISEVILGLSLTPEQVHHPIVSMMTSKNFWPNYLPEISPREISTLSSLLCEKIAISFVSSNYNSVTKMEELRQINPSFDRSQFKKCYERIIKKSKLEKLKK